MSTAPGCPSCSEAMTAERFPHKLRGEVEINLCFSCRALWFDKYESEQITPGGIIDLFKLIHAHHDAPARPLADRLGCPRCHERMLPTQDIVLSGPFNYHRCLQQHGRLITFGQFMTEKGFTRHLAPDEIKALSARVATIRCHGCGAPVDLKHDPACSHCRAPVSVLDADAVEKALARYHHAELERNSVDPLRLADALTQRPRAPQRSPNPLIFSAGASGAVDLLGAGISLLASLFNN